MKSDWGKLFEKEAEMLLRAACSEVERVHDARSHWRPGSTQPIAPPVHCDYTAIIGGRARLSVLYPDEIRLPTVSLTVKAELNLYFEMKASKTRNGFEFRKLVKGDIKASKEKAFAKLKEEAALAGGADPVVPDEWWSKYNQWGYCYRVHRNAATSQYWYMIGNRHSNSNFLIYMMDWSDIAHWLSWLEEANKKKPTVSIPWSALQQRAMETGGLDKILYQEKGGTGKMRFATEENVAKLRRLMGVGGWDVRVWQ